MPRCLNVAFSIDRTDLKFFYLKIFSVANVMKLIITVVARKLHD